MPSGVKKQNLPSKICVVCQKPFSWRKKWAKVWEDVKYCSERCKKNRHPERVRKHDEGSYKIPPNLRFVRNDDGDTP